VSPETGAGSALEVGPTRVLLAGMPDDVIEAARNAIGEAFSHHVDDDGHVVVSGRINLVTARRP
jgi:hypothetical protein